MLVCLPLAVPIGLSPLLILTLCGSERVLVVSTEHPDDVSGLTTRGGGGGFPKMYVACCEGEQSLSPTVPEHAT